MTDFAICNFYSFIFYFEQKDLKSQSIEISTISINIFFQLTRTIFKFFVINYILREKARYHTSQKMFGIDSTTVRHYVSCNTA